MSMSMTSSNAHDPHEADSSAPLKGLYILLVEDSRDVGEAISPVPSALVSELMPISASSSDAEIPIMRHRPPRMSPGLFNALTEALRGAGASARAITIRYLCPSKMLGRRDAPLASN